VPGPIDLYDKRMEAGAPAAVALAERAAVPTNPKIKAAPTGLIFVDLPRFMDEGARWTRLFRETFSVR
jgi:hypothetical protein